MSEKDMFSPESNLGKARVATSEAIKKFETDENLMLEYLRKALGGEAIKEGPNAMLRKIISIYIRENNPDLKEGEVDKVLTDKKQEIHEALFLKYLEANKRRKKDMPAEKPKEVGEQDIKAEPSIESSINSPAGSTATVKEKERKSQSAGELDWREEINDEREKNK